MPTHTIVMTGATRGIGRIAAQHILEEDPDVHLVLVSRGTAPTALAADLEGEGGTVTAVSADLDSLASVRAAADEIASRLESGELPPLRGFVGNAGIQHTDDLTETADGIEATFAVNVVANHLLVHSLGDKFQPGSRITITVSDTHFGDFAHNMGMVPAPVWSSPEELARVGTFKRPSSTAAGRAAYSTSKLAAIYWVHEAARRMSERVEVVSFNPGFVPGTGIARHADPVSRFMMRRVMPVLTLTSKATSPAAAGRDLADVVLGTTPAPSGAYVDRTAVAPSSDESYDPAREAELWEALERITAS